jgi:hypothetical protein
MRRALLLAPLLLMACTEDPVTDYLGGFGDPVRGASLWGPRNLGDTTRWEGDPAGAAMAAAQLEFLARSFRENPLWAPGTAPGTLAALAAGQREMRAALGIRPAAPSAAVEIQLRAASEALRAGSRVGAEAALSGSDFTLPPAETLGRLGSLPRLPAVAWAGGAVAEEIGRRDRRRG